ncbi:hypothetical protein ACFQL7_28565 [Halocatena marina]|uniref:Uncharacterized protein n=1 Tax=Halocatena marina TaxID=2934937 RepID=A0ABD5YYY2_9EURY|nr:hypothetical protein [Halocatena marina]
MEFNRSKTIGVFGVLFAIIASGTFMSPMTTSTVMMVLGGLLVFGILTLFIGIKHGKHLAANR